MRKVFRDDREREMFLVGAQMSERKSVFVETCRRICRLDNVHNGRLRFRVKRDNASNAGDENIVDSLSSGIMDGDRVCPGNELLGLDQRRVESHGKFRKSWKDTTKV